MKFIYIFAALTIHFVFSTQFFNASGLNESYSLRGGLSTVNEAGFIFNNMKTKIWKDVKGYKGYYQVSNFGNVRSLDRYVATKGSCKKLYLKFAKGKMLIPCKKQRKYYCVCLSKDGVSKPVNLHRIIAKAFVLNPMNKPEVNHKDGNKLNNKIENLEWCTCSENRLHAHRTGLHNGAGNSKLTISEVLKIRELYSVNNCTRKKLSEIYKVSRKCINRIIKKDSWKYL